MDVEREIDRLYQRPLGEFVQVRASLTKAVRPEDPPKAKLIAKLPKPSVSAWAVNQVYWFEQPAFEAMMSAGERVRAAQQKAMAGEGGLKGLQEAIEERAAALEGLMRAAEIALVRCGHGANVGTLRRVETTLSELANRGTAAWGTSAGRLVSDVEATGFDVLAGLAASIPAHKAVIEPPPQHQTKTEAQPPLEPAEEQKRRAAIAAARRLLESAESDLAAKEAAALGTTVEAANKRRLAGEAAAALEDARQLHEAARERASSADEKLAKAEKRADDAAAECERARQALSVARERFDALEESLARP